MSRSTERELLDWLSRQPGTGGHLGDDAAILSDGEGWIVTVDFQILGTHLPADIDEATFARRLLAVNLSDIAAMGARASHCFLALAAPMGFAHRDFFLEFLDACRSHGLVLAGGDLSSAETAVASLTVLAKPTPGSQVLRRSSAEAEQTIWLGGPVGVSALGCELVSRGGRLRSRKPNLPESCGVPAELRPVAAEAVLTHLEPQPQVDLGQWLAPRAASCTDVSDGLARDLHELCNASHVGALIDEGALPSVPGFEALAAHLDLDSLALMLGGDEDYVLLFTLPADVEPPAELGCHRIGRTTLSQEILLRDGQGRSRPLADLGWDHLSRQ